MKTVLKIKFSLIHACLALGVLLFATDAWGAAEYASGALNWANTGGSSLWSTTSGSGYTSPWTNGNTAVFEGSGGTVTLTGTATTGPGTATAGGMGFTADGYSLSASSAQSLNVGNAAQSSFITVASGSTATIGNYVKLTKATTGNSELDLLGGGTLVIGSGLGTLGTSGAIFDLSATGSSGNACYVVGDSTLQVSSDATVKYFSTLVLGGTSATTGNATGGGILTVNGGTLSIGTGLANANLVLGNDNTQAKAATATLNSGSITVPSYNGTLTGGGVRFGSGAATWTRTFNLNGGTLSAYQVYVGSAGAASVFNFNGGTLKPLVANASFMNGLTTANVRDGGAVIDAAGKAITIGQALVHSTIGGDNATDGGLILKDSVGGGILTLTNAETYTGPTVIAAGTLVLTNTASLNANSSIGIGPGAIFDVTAQTSGYTFGSGSSLLATGSVSSASIKGAGTISLNSRPMTLSFTPAGFLGDATHPALTVAAGTLSIGSSTITVVNGAGSPLGAGDYVLINTNGTGVISGTPTLDTSSGVGAGTGMAVNTSVSLAYNSSGYLILHVTSSLPATTTTIALHSPWTSTNTYGDALQFTVTVSGGSSPGGMVTVYDGGSSGTVIGTNTLSGGSAIVTLNPLTGLSVGLHTNIVAVYAGDNNNQGSASSPLAAQTVNPKNLTVAGAAAIGKCYDGTTNGATITGTLSGVVGSDVVTLNGSGTFANAGPGTGIAVTTALTLVGAPATNYSLTQPTGLAANIVTNAPWNVAAGGAWETAGNWTNSIVATNTGNTADFTAVNLTADATITNNGPKTIGNLAFGDTDTSTPAGWTVSGSTLTLAATTPAITVNALGAGKNVTINSIIAGTNGLTKTGNGTLQLNGVNTYTNGTVVKAGVLNFGADSGFGAVPSSAATNNITLDGGTMTLTGNNQSLNANRGIWVTSNGGGISNSLVGTGNLNVLGIIDGPGMVTVGVVSQSGVLLSGANTYSGGTVLSGAANGNVFCMMNSAGPAGAPTSGTFGTGPVTFNGSGTRSTAGADTTVGNPIIFAADTTFPTLASEKSLTFNGPVTLTNGTRTLTVNIGATVAGKSLTLAGAIGDGGNGYGLTKAGTGVLNLTGINTYTGNTTVKAGTLSISNACLAAGSTISISNSAVLNLAFSTTNTVTGLITNGVSLTNGVYSSNNVAPFITGSGYLQVGITGPDLSQNRLTNSVTAGGTVLSLSWSPGWKLQAQTNSLSTGLSTNWTYVTDGTVNSTNLPIVLGNPTVFYRLKSQ